MGKSSSYSSKVPVLCIGNFIAGGAGKTPTAIAISKVARAQGLRPGFLSRGYGGSETSVHLVDPRQDTARQVGDEPLLLAAHALTVISSDRVAGAKKLEDAGASVIIMDDGFQNPSLQKDYSLVVVDAFRGIGNGFVHPAGPLRAPLQTQLSHASGVLIIGKSAASAHVVRKAARMAKPVITGDLKVPNGARWHGVRVMAYCGIGAPEKFIASLRSVGAVIVEERHFPDHHAYSRQDCDELLSRANELKVALVTTEKDKVRLLGASERHQALHSNSFALPVELVFENPKRIEGIIESAKANFAKQLSANS